MARGSGEQGTWLITIREDRAIPVDGLVLGYGAMLPFPVAAVAVWVGGGEVAAAAATLAILLGAALALFLSGVRRGLSFRTEGGPRPGQIAMMLWLFAVGLAALLIPERPAIALLAAVFLSLLILDPIAARRGEVPLYFARLRPPQMAIPVLSLLAIFAGRA